MPDICAIGVTRIVRSDGTTAVDINYTKALPKSKNSWSIWYPPPHYDNSDVIEMQTWSCRRLHQGPGAKISLLEEALAQPDIQWVNPDTKEVTTKPFWNPWAHKILTDELLYLQEPRASGGAGKSNGTRDERYAQMEKVEITPTTTRSTTTPTAPAAAEARSAESNEALARVRALKDKDKDKKGGEAAAKADDKKPVTAAAAVKQPKDSVKTS